MWHHWVWEEQREKVNDSARRVGENTKNDTAAAVATDRPHLSHGACEEDAPVQHPAAPGGVQAVGEDRQQRHGVEQIHQHLQRKIRF